MVVNCCIYENGRRSQDIKVDEISKYVGRPNSFIWIGLFEPEEELLRKVQAQFGLHDLAIEDAHSAHQRPKVESYGDSLFLALKTVQKVDNKIQFGETHFFVGAGYIVTVRHGASLSYSAARIKCEQVPDQLARGPGFALYAVMDFIVDNYFPVVEEFEDELLSVEETIFKGNYQAETTEKIYDLKSDIMALRRATVPLLEICNILIRSTTTLITADTTPYFRDVHDHVARINEVIETIREMLNTALQVSLSLASLKQNDVVKKQAGWAAILLVPTVIASIYGMNFQNMPELHSEYGYPIVMGAVGAICLYLYVRLRKADWL